MDAHQVSYVPPEMRHASDFDTARVTQQQRDGFRAPLMDRAGGSSSSRGTDCSYQSMNSALSPSSSSFIDSPTSGDGPSFPQTSSKFCQNSLLSLTSPTLPTSSVWPPAESIFKDLPLFDIEKDGDPAILPQTYYDFKVGKKESFFELKPGYKVTHAFPHRKKIECAIDKNSGKKVHVCKSPFCTAKPFTRHYDLERHFTTVHDYPEYFCDYRKCPHNRAFRKDHAREHYREYHSEDLVKRNDPCTNDFLAKKAEYIALTWYRCTRCLARVNIKRHGYKCATCNVPCEPERVELRQRLTLEMKEKETSYLSSSGQYENVRWIPDQSSPQECDLYPSC